MKKSKDNVKFEKHVKNIQKKSPEQIKSELEFFNYWH